jgi:hypothetical protein
MGSQKRVAKHGVAFALAMLVLNYAYLKQGVEASQPAAPRTSAPPSKNDVYAGLTKCAACHFKQYEDWKTSPHGRTFDYLPVKYRNDAECLKCHTGKYGRAASERAPTKNLSGVSCEDCHGPGREHSNLALRYVANGQELTDEAVNVLRSKIQRTALDQCIKCHVLQAHQPHPEYDRDENVGGRQGELIPPRKTSFFRVH